MLLAAAYLEHGTNAGSNRRQRLRYDHVVSKASAQLQRGRERKTRNRVRGGYSLKDPGGKTLPVAGHLRTYGKLRGWRAGLHLLIRRLHNHSSAAGVCVAGLNRLDNLSGYSPHAHYIPLVHQTKAKHKT
jgi:hypothetical protein